VPSATFDAFKAELVALREILSGLTKKTVRDESVRERVRTLFRAWTSAVRPRIRPLVQSKRSFWKLDGELEALAKLTSKYKPVADYRKRIGRAIQLANELVLYMPPGETAASVAPHGRGNEPFLSGVPDVPLRLVPNALLGWRSAMQAFVARYSFDRLVFIMIRYRERNDPLIEAIKHALAREGHNGILASEHNLTGDLYNPVACLLCCSRGIAVFDRAEPGQVFNPNVAYELGMLHLLGRDCLILKDESLETLHTDILMKLYRAYGDAGDAGAEVLKWLAEA